MKKLLLAISVLLTAFSAVASPIPDYVEKTLKTYQYDNYSLRNGVLTLSLRKPVINKETA
ncbi:hypothetical protein [Pantoea vagans]|nr:hypothetical protein [Pantoea vagans]